MRHAFLSPEWISAVQDIRAEFIDHDGPVELDLAANVTVTDPPFGDGPVLGHIDTNGPTLMIEHGHLANSDFGIELPYTLARQLFVDRDAAAVMPALMGGQVKLTGDSSKVLMLASTFAPPADDQQVSIVREVVRRVDAVTA